MKHPKPAPYKGVEDHLRDLCRIYRGETDNPHDVDSLLDDERAIQFLRFHLWDAERSILENPALWKFRILEEYGSVPVEDSALASRIYEYAINTKLNGLKEIGIDLTDVYRRTDR